MKLTERALAGWKPDAKKMLTLKKTENGYDVEINPSSLGLLQQCWRKSYYNLHEGLVNKFGAAPLTFGSAIHGFLEEYYTSPREERVLMPNFKENIIKMCQGESLPGESSSLIYRATRRFIEGMEPLAYLDSKDARSVENGGWLIGEYVELKKDDPYEVMVKDGKPLVEAMYSHVIYEEQGKFGHLRIILFGTIDAILVNTSTGQIHVTDHKTAAQIGPQLYNRTKPNHQFTAYIHLAQLCLGLDTDNFMVNVFNVKKKPVTTRGTGPSFLNLHTKRSPEDIQEFIETTAFYVKAYLERIEENIFPLGPVDACANYGRCAYLDICEAPPATRDAIAEFNYNCTKEL